MVQFSLAIRSMDSSKTIPKLLCCFSFIDVSVLNIFTIQINLHPDLLIIRDSPYPKLRVGANRGEIGLNFIQVVGLQVLTFSILAISFF